MTEGDEYKLLSLRTGLLVGYLEGALPDQGFAAMGRQMSQNLSEDTFTRLKDAALARGLTPEKLAKILALVQKQIDLMDHVRMLYLKISQDSGK